MRLEKTLGALLLAAMLCGCAIGNTIDYATQVPELTVASSRTVAVGVQYLRPYVISGHNTPQFVGLQRGGYGNPFGVHTSSGNPLAQDMANAIVSALSEHDIKTESIVLPSAEP